jgi:hypothetical protein
MRLFSLNKRFTPQAALWIGGLRSSMSVIHGGAPQRAASRKALQIQGFSVAGL